MDIFNNDTGQSCQLHTTYWTSIRWRSSFGWSSNVHSLILIFYFLVLYQYVFVLLCYLTAFYADKKRHIYRTVVACYFFQRVGA